MRYVAAADAAQFLSALRDESVDLFLIDPPYYQRGGKSLWDNQWESGDAYAAWLIGLCDRARRKVRPTGSLVIFQPLGKQGQHPIFQVVAGVERSWHFRNWITWKKSRAFGNADNYLHGRDEILWFTASSKPGEFTFNAPTLAERAKRGKRDFKAVSNVWDDVAQVFRPARICQRPLPLIARLVRAHSNPRDLVADFFTGWGTTGIVAHHLGRRFLGCEAIAEDAAAAERRIVAAKTVAG